jgi:hypothetical protein
MRRIRRRLKAVIATAFLTSLVVVAGAQAAQSVTLTRQGSDPQLAVDGAGDAHVVWSTQAASGTDSVTYCKLPDGGTTCAITHTFSTGLTGITQSAHVVLGPAAGEVVVLAVPLSSV